MPAGPMADENPFPDSEMATSGCILPGQQGQELSAVSLIRALISFMRVPTS